MTYQVKDPVTGGVRIVTRPESEWKQREVPHLLIFPADLCERIDARLAKTRAAYQSKKRRPADSPRRTDVYATRLVRPVCGVCGQPLWLGRSGKYASFTCLSGKDGKGGCTFRGYKSVRIVEETVTREVAAWLFTDGFIASVVKEANGPDPPPRDPTAHPGPDPHPRPPPATPGGPDLIVDTAFVQTVRHFFPDLNDWLPALLDSRDRDAITDETRFLAWTGLFLLQLGSRRQLDFAFDRYSEAALCNLNRLARTRQESLPVHDTLDHFLDHVPAHAFLDVRWHMTQRLLRMKALEDARVLGRYVVLLDGTGRFSFRQRHCDACLERKHKSGTTYHHQVLEAKLLGPASVVLSIGTEFIENAAHPSRHPWVAARNRWQAAPYRLGFGQSARWPSVRPMRPRSD